MIIILGSTGMLGNYVYQYLKQFYSSDDIKCMNRSDIDILEINYQKLEDYFNLNGMLDKNNVIINCIGLIHQTNCTDHMKYLKINTIFPQWLAIISLKFGLHVIHPSSDCIFDGCSNECYSEDDMYNATDIYGISKSMGENNVLTIIRTSFIGEEKYNKKSLLEWVKSNRGKEINGYVNHYWNGITCLEFAKIVYEIIDKNLYWNGIRHFYSNKIISKYDLLEMINEIYQLNIKINKYHCEKTINRSLISKHNIQIKFEPDLYKQIVGMKNFHFL